MRGTNGFRLVIGIGACVVLSALGGCQGSGTQSAASAPAASAPASAIPMAQGNPPIGLAAYQPPEAASPLASCNIETVNGQPFGSGASALQSNHANIFNGWLFAAGVVNPIYRMRFDSGNSGRHLQADLSLTVQRPDVAAAQPGAPLASGFSLTLPPGALPVGAYHVYLAVESGGKTYVCDSGRHIDVQ